AFRSTPATVAALAGPAALAAPAALAGHPSAAATPAVGDGGTPDDDGDGGVSGLLGRAWDALAGGMHERVVLSSHKLAAGLEAASSAKVAAVAASATALAGGGAAALHVKAESPVPAARASLAQPASPERTPTRTSPRDAV